MATLRDIAEATGLNISTVSRALNGNRYISRKTCELVEKVAGELGYSTPQMRRSKERSIALIVPELRSQYYVDMIHTFKSRLNSKGYIAIFTIGGYSCQEMGAAIQEIKKFDVSGMFLVSGGIAKKELFAVASLLSGIPSILLSETSHLTPVDTIFIDQSYIVELVVKHLKAQNYKEIGYIGEHLSGTRLNALKLSCRQNDIIIDENMIFSGEERFEEGGYLRAKDMLKCKKLPDAVVASYDEIAIGAMRAFKEAGIRIPEDIAIIGIDDVRMASYLSPQLTSVNTPVEQMCVSAIDLLLNQIENRHEHIVQHISLQSKLILRESTIKSD